MVSERASDIGHRGVAICNPVSSATLDAVVERATLEPGQTAVDVGCGKGELLLRLAARYPVSGLGLDRNGERVAEARHAAGERGLAGRLRFLREDARSFEAQEPFALTACVGSTHALGGLQATLERLAGWTAPGGWVLIGEGFWARAPDPDYLQAIGATRDELGADGWAEAAAREAELDPVERWTATREEWDAYEGAILANMESYAKEAADDPEAPAMLDEQRAFHAGQVRWGRDTMGFALHLLRRGP